MNFNPYADPLLIPITGKIAKHWAKTKTELTASWKLPLKWNSSPVGRVVVDIISEICFQQNFKNFLTQYAKLLKRKRIENDSRYLKLPKNQYLLWLSICRGSSVKCCLEFGVKLHWWMISWRSWVIQVWKIVTWSNWTSFRAMLLFWTWCPFWSIVFDFLVC